MCFLEVFLFNFYRKNKTVVALQSWEMFFGEDNFLLLQYISIAAPMGNRTQA